MKYIKNAIVGKDTVPQPSVKEVHLFGKTCKVYDDDWRTHLHLIITHKCNAKCAFCIERDSIKLWKEDPEALLSTAIAAMREMHHEGILKTISITGGEPLLSPTLAVIVDYIRMEYPSVFLTMNTNGALLSQFSSFFLDKFDWINISRHSPSSIKNNDVMNVDAPFLFELRKLKSRLKRVKLRCQAVLTSSLVLEDFLSLVKLGAFDDLSFRMPMIEEGMSKKEIDYNYSVYFGLINRIKARSGVLITQEIQDYYVYETWEVEGVQVTLSYSNMTRAEQEDKTEDDFHREFIIRPDGSFTSSWGKGKVIYAYDK